MKSPLNISVISRCLWTAAIGAVVVGSLSPGNSSLMVAVGRLRVGDKVLHFTAYLLLAILQVIGFRRGTSIVWAVAASVSLGLLLEIIQNFVPGRSPEVADQVANMMGIGCGMALAFPFRALTPSPTRTNRPDR